MNTDNRMSLIRTGLKVIGAILATKGVMTVDQSNELLPLAEILVGGIISMAGLVMSWKKHTPKKRK